MFLTNQDPKGVSLERLHVSISTATFLSGLSNQLTQRGCRNNGEWAESSPDRHPGGDFVFGPAESGSPMDIMSNISLIRKKSIKIYKRARRYTTEYLFAMPIEES